MLKRIKKISTKLLAAFLLVTILSSAAGVVGTFILRNIDTKYSDALVDYGFSQGSIGKLGMVLNENRAWVRDIVYLTDQKDLDTAYQKIQTNATSFDALMEEVRPTNTSQEAKDLFAEIEADMLAYRQVRDQVVAYGMSNDSQRASALMSAQAGPMIDQVITKVEKLLAMNIDAGTKMSNELSQLSSVSMIIMVFLVVIGILMSVVIAILMARSISRPIITVGKAALQLRDGDLNIDIHSDELDEVGQMTRSFAEAAKQMRTYITDISHVLAEVSGGNFNIGFTQDFAGDFRQIEVSIQQIITSLSDTLGQIDRSAQQVSAGSEQVSSGAQALAQGAAEQASSVEELAATINEISAQVRKNAQNADQAKTQSQISDAQVTESDRRMAEMMTAMNNISAKSGEISKIIKTIEDIAFQTNILALNAAVEAARAGTAGKGFAVVADEVRNLSKKSSEAASNTTALIEETIHAVGEGTEIAAQTAKAMHSVVKSNEQIAVLIDAIASASRDQSEALSQVTQGVEQISGVVQTNSATAEQSAAASEELSSLAETLKGLVGQFQLRPQMPDSSVGDFVPVGARGVPSSLSGRNTSTGMHTGKY